MESIIFEKFSNSHYSRLRLAVNELVSQGGLSRLQILKIFATAFNSRMGMFLHKVLSGLKNDSETLQSDMWILIGTEKECWDTEDITSSIESMINWREEQLSLSLSSYDIDDTYQGDEKFNEVDFMSFLKKNEYPALELFERVLGQRLSSPEDQKLDANVLRSVADKNN
jgi:hypothetical protein